GAPLLEAGVRLIAPQFALTGVDVRALPPEIQSVFEQPALRAVFDVGGDDAGAVALGQYSARLRAADAALYYVVNVFRPRSATPREIVDMIDRIADRARLAPAGLINNANLGDETTPRLLDQGEAVLREVSRLRGIPVVAASGTAEALAGRTGGAPAFEIRRLMKPEWMDA
ncbi:MAG: hypothetical protein GX558_05825, partial [Clostridiales bacterium]|nr:hypothetical protein [Clostridiales bacterium]